MIMKRFFLFCCCFSFYHALAQTQLFLNPTQSSYQLAPYTDLFEDTNRILTFNDIIKNTSTNFRPVNDVDVNIGFSTSNLWLRFALISPKAQTYYLDLHDCLLDQVELHQIDEKGHHLRLTTGDAFPFYKRPVHNLNFTLVIPLKAHQRSVFYLRVSSRDAMQLTMVLKTQHDFLVSSTRQYLLLGLYFGASILVMIYNILLFWLVRDKNYLYYFSFLLPFFISNLSVEGLSFQYLWPNWPCVANMANTFFTGVASATGIWFAIHFLNLRHYLSRGLPIYYSFMGIGAGISLLSCFFYTVALNQFTAFYLIIACALLLCTSLYVINQGFQPGKYYLIGWGVFFLFSTLFMLRNATLIPSDYMITTHGYQVAFLLQQIIFTYGIGYNMRQYKREKELTQKQLYQQLLENERTRSRIARDLHDDIGSTLSSILILSGISLGQAIQNNLTAAQLLTRIHHSTRNMLDRMKDIVWATRSDHDALSCLATRMREFAVSILEATNIQFSLLFDDTLHSCRLPVQANYDLYVVFKEAINNIAKHAEATAVVVEVRAHPQGLLLKIQDNGKGFDTSQTKGGNGVGNIEKRAHYLGGKVCFNSQPGKGTEIVLTIPLQYDHMIV
jgi:signal transduction histidine kinase